MMMIGSLRRQSTPLPSSHWLKRAVNQVTSTSGVSEENKKEQERSLWLELDVVSVSLWTRAVRFFPPFKMDFGSVL